MIYYRSTEFEGIALGLSQLLGVGTIQLSDKYLGAPVTIVVGNDYATVRGFDGLIHGAPGLTSAIPDLA